MPRPIPCVNLRLTRNTLALTSAISAFCIPGERHELPSPYPCHCSGRRAGCRKSLERQREDFFLPVRVVSRLFRGKYLAELKQLWKDGKLEFHGTAEPYRNHYALQELLDTCYKKEWIPYCKKPFHGAESVIRYLGRYTHRIAISNYRIKCMTDSMVTFTAKDYKNQGQWEEITVSGEEFIRRFLMHVPPKRFVRIRHYGLLSSRNKNKKITLCRNLLGCRKYIARLKDLDAPAMIRLLYNKDICRCSSCGGRIIPLPAGQPCTMPEPHLLC